MGSSGPNAYDRLLSAASIFASAPSRETLSELQSLTAACRQAHERASMELERLAASVSESGGPAASGLLEAPDARRGLSRRSATLSAGGRPMSAMGHLGGGGLARTASAGALNISAEAKEAQAVDAFELARAYMLANPPVQETTCESVEDTDAETVVCCHVLVLLPDDSQTEVHVSCSLSLTVGQAKELVMEEVMRMGVTLGDASELRMRSVQSSAANDEPTVLRELAAVRNAFRRRHSLSAGVVTVRFFLMPKDFIRREKYVTMQIGSLVGIPLNFYDKADDEVNAFRDEMKRFRAEARAEGQIHTAAIEAHLMTDVPVPEDFPTELVFRFRFKEDVVKTGKLCTQDTPTEALRKLFDKFGANLAVLLSGDGGSTEPEDYVFKVPGLRNYIWGDTHPLHDFTFVRKIGVKPPQGRFLTLGVVPRASIRGFDEGMDDSPILEPVFQESELVKSHFFHKDLTVRDRPDADATPYLSIWDIDEPLKVFVSGIDNLKYQLRSWYWKKEHRKFDDEGSAAAIFIEAAVYHGQELLAPPAYSRVMERRQCSQECPRFYEWLPLTIETRRVPKAARLCITVWGQKKLSVDLSADSENNYALGWTSLQLINFQNFLVQGEHTFRLWEFDPANPIGTTCDNPDSQAPVLHVRFPTRVRQVVFPMFATPEDVDMSAIPAPAAEDAIIMKDVVARDPLADVTAAEKEVLWGNRYSLVDIPAALPKFLLSVHWDDPEQVREAHRMVDIWEPMEPVASLELLDANYFDAHVRSFAVECLERITNSLLGDFLLQLVQVIKYEPYHDSPLARFLLRRALGDRRIGHSFYWYLRAEVEDPAVVTRVSLMLESYLRGCGCHRDLLVSQSDLLGLLLRTAEAIKNVKNAERLDLMHQMLTNIGDEPVQLLIDEQWEVGRLLLPKCKFMDSKKLPLWLVYENADPFAEGDLKQIYVIFKAGDDLRQDKLTLQLFAIMDKLWEQAGIPTRLDPYNCVATGSEQGFIEVVRHANTVSNIQQDYGGTRAAFKEEPLEEWLKGLSNSDAEYQDCVKVFVKSLAAYSVATYVLGIGDRHNDNIMLQESGRLFHIDFGHFLGNIKKKFGVSRERSPFVITSDMLRVLGGEGSPTYHEYVELACEAYIVIRQNASLFITLMSLMVSTGIPELRSTKDLAYLRVALALELKTDAEAVDYFRGVIAESVAKRRATETNFFAHNMAHRRK